MKGAAVCAKKSCLPFTLHDLRDPGSRAFHLQEQGADIEGFVVRKGDQLYAYYNQCPHTGVGLNWAQDVFLNYDEQYIQCSMHGALFTLAEGRCIWGPCAGQFLQALTCEVDSRGQIYLEL